MILVEGAKEEENSAKAINVNSREISETTNKKGKKNENFHDKWRKTMGKVATFSFMINSKNRFKNIFISTT